MSNLRKRFLALAIVAVMLVAALSSTAFAATSEFADISDAEETKMVKLLSALQIVLGRPADEDGVKNFDRDALVNRQEMAMFLARINSATPGAFNDAEAAAAAKIAFEDVTDSTFFLAIQYCHEQGIITGATAETFNPTDTVTLDQALAMIIRALGYKDIDTSKNFIESTKKAKELGFALTYKDNEGGKKLTRIEVISLLYKYFYSDEQSLEIVKNEFTGVQSVQRVPHPVMAKFGINVQEAYIVRAGDYKTTLNYKLEDPRGEDIDVTPMNVPQLTAREMAEGKDIILAYPDFKVGSLKANGLEYNYTGKWIYIATSKVDLDCADKDNRYLAGLKVVYYQDTLAATRPVDLGILSYVKGTKLSLADADPDEYTTTTSMKSDLKDFEDYSKGIELFNNKYDLRQYAAQKSALTDADIYQFNKDAVLSSTNNTNSIAVVTQLAKFIKKGGNFGLEYVVNDYAADGTPTEIFYIFTPYSAAYYEKDDRYDDNDNLKYRLFKNGNGTRIDEENGSVNRALSWYFQNPDSSRNIVVKSYVKGVDKVEIGNAYLYTLEGNNLNIFDKLDKVVDAKYPEYVIERNMKFADMKAFELAENNRFIALGATDKNNGYMTTGKYSAFRLSTGGDIFFIYKNSDPLNWKDVTNNYGVLTEKPTYVANYLGTQRMMYMYPVFTYADNRVITMVAENLVGEYDYYGGNSRLQPGILVSYQQVGDYYRIGAFDVLNNLYLDTNGHFVAAGDDLVTANSATSYNQFSGLFKLATTTDSIRGYVTDSTQILVAETDKDGETFLYARKWTKAQLDSWLSSVASYNEESILNIEVITEVKNSESRIKAILITTPYTGSFDSNTYLTITDTLTQASGNSGIYTLAKAWDYINNREDKVALDSSAYLAKGQVVRRLSERYTEFGEKYWIVSAVPSKAVQHANAPLTARGSIVFPLTKTGTAPDTYGWNSGIRGAFSQLNLLKSNIESRTNTWRDITSVSALISALQSDYFAYPVATLNSERIASEETTQYLALVDIPAFWYTNVTGSTPKQYLGTAEPSTDDINDMRTAGGTSPGSTTTKYGPYKAGDIIKDAKVAEYIETSVGTSSGDNISAQYLVGGTNTPQGFGTAAAMLFANANDGVVVVADMAELSNEHIASEDYVLVEVERAYDSVSKLYGNRKINLVTITVPTTGIANTTVAIDKIDGDGLRDLERDNIDRGLIGGNTYNPNIKANGSGYYIITNNINENIYSDVVTLVKLDVK